VAKGYPWFKHFASASQGESLKLLIVEGELESVAIFWIILELVCRWEKPESPGRITVSWKLLSKETHCLIPKLRKRLFKLTQNSLIRLSDEIEARFELSVPMWAELQRRHGPNSDRTFPELGGRSKKEEVRSNISSEIEICFEEWGTTLKHFGILKDPRLDELTIARLIERYGCDQTLLALRGARFEPKSEKYDPAKYCSITRVAKPEKFSRFVNLGAQVSSKPKYDRHEVSDDATV